MQLCTGGVWGEKSEKKRGLATVVSSGTNLKKKQSEMLEMKTQWLR